MHRSELDFVRDMFNRIAPRYDFLNRFLSLRQDVYWRRTQVASLSLTPGARVLDAACGTADVGLEILRQTRGGALTVGVDFAPEMLRLAAPKIEKAAYPGGICLAAADAFDLPFRPGGFDAVTMAFGIRNIQDKATVLRRFWDQLKPGGRLAILELATPDQGVLRRAYLLYFNRLLPFIGRFFFQPQLCLFLSAPIGGAFPGRPSFCRPDAAGRIPECALPETDHGDHRFICGRKNLIG